MSRINRGADGGPRLTRNGTRGVAHYASTGGAIARWRGWRRRRVEASNHDVFGLATVALEAFCGLFFVARDDGAEPLASQAGDLAEDHWSLVSDDERMLPKRGFDTFGDGIRCGWKVAVDDHPECCRCRKAPPALPDLLDMDAYRTDAFGTRSRQYPPNVAGSNGDGQRRHRRGRSVRPGNVIPRPSMAPIPGGGRKPAPPERPASRAVAAGAPGPHSSRNASTGFSATRRR